MGGEGPTWTNGPRRSGGSAPGVLPAVHQARQGCPIATLDDTARFRVDDPDELVAASFACPACLGAQVEVVVSGDDDEHTGRCECRMCGTGWAVALTTWQVVRLRVHPPGRGAVHGPGLRVRALT